MRETKEDTEAARWQTRIEETIRRHGLEPSDCSGNESGDPLDWTDDQVSRALYDLEEQRDAAQERLGWPIEAAKNYGFDDEDAVDGIIHCLGHERNDLRTEVASMRPVAEAALTLHEAEMAMVGAFGDEVTAVEARIAEARRVFRERCDAYHSTPSEPRESDGEGKGFSAAVGAVADSLPTDDEIVFPVPETKFTPMVRKDAHDAALAEVERLRAEVERHQNERAETCEAIGGSGLDGSPLARQVASVIARLRGDRDDLQSSLTYVALEKEAVVAGFEKMRAERDAALASIREDGQIREVYEAAVAHYHASKAWTMPADGVISLTSPDPRMANAVEAMKRLASAVEAALAVVPGGKVAQ